MKSDINACIHSICNTTTSTSAVCRKEGVVCALGAAVSGVFPATTGTGINRAILTTTGIRSGDSFGTRTGTLSSHKSGVRTAGRAITRVDPSWAILGVGGRINSTGTMQASLGAVEEHKTIVLGCGGAVT